MAEPTIDELVEQLNTAASSYKDASSGTKRIDTINAARNIITALNDPADALLQLTYTVKLPFHFVVFSCAKTRTLGVDSPRSFLLSRLLLTCGSAKR